MRNLGWLSHPEVACRTDALFLDAGTKVFTVIFIYSLSSLIKWQAFYADSVIVFRKLRVSFRGVSKRRKLILVVAPYWWWRIKRRWIQLNRSKTICWIEDFRKSSILEKRALTFNLEQCTGSDFKQESKNFGLNCSDWLLQYKFTCIICILKSI